MKKTLSENPEFSELMQFIYEVKDKDERQVLINSAANLLLRIKLFNKAVDAITGIADIHIEDENGNSRGLGANLIYDKYTDQSVDFIHMADDVIELHVNNECVLRFSKTSPILEAFYELFELIKEELE